MSSFLCSSEGHHFLWLGCAAGSIYTRTGVSGFWGSWLHECSLLLRQWGSFRDHTFLCGVGGAGVPSASVLFPSIQETSSPLRWYIPSRPLQSHELSNFPSPIHRCRIHQCVPPPPVLPRLGPPGLRPCTVVPPDSAFTAVPVQL